MGFLGGRRILPDGGCQAGRGVGRGQDVEELADLLEVIYAAARARGVTPQDLENLRLEKARARGGFEKRIRLLEVDG